jgi:hypothetical protein
MPDNWNQHQWDASAKDALGRLLALSELPAIL